MIVLMVSDSEPNPKHELQINSSYCKNEGFYLSRSVTEMPFSPMAKKLPLNLQNSRPGKNICFVQAIFLKMVPRYFIYPVGQNFTWTKLMLNLKCMLVVF